MASVRVVIVDDDDNIRALVQARLELDGGVEIVCDADSAESGIEAWRRLRPDVIVMDQQMPGMTGLEATAEILAEDPAQPIILYSAYLMPEDIEHAERLGVCCCLSKEKLDELSAAILLHSDRK